MMLKMRVGELLHGRLTRAAEGYKLQVAEIVRMALRWSERTGFVDSLRNLDKSTVRAVTEQDEAVMDRWIKVMVDRWLEPTARGLYDWQVRACIYKYLEDYERLHGAPGSRQEPKLPPECRTTRAGIDYIVEDAQ